MAWFKKADVSGYSPLKGKYVEHDGWFGFILTEPDAQGNVRLMMEDHSGIITVNVSELHAMDNRTPDTSFEELDAYYKRNYADEYTKQAAYGDKRDFPKIDIFIDGVYDSSTTWAKSCKEAKEQFLLKYPNYTSEQVRCEFAGRYAALKAKAKGDVNEQPEDFVCAKCKEKRSGRLFSHVGPDGKDYCTLCADKAKETVMKESAKYSSEGMVKVTVKSALQAEVELGGHATEPMTIDAGEEIVLVNEYPDFYEGMWHNKTIYAGIDEIDDKTELSGASDTEDAKSPRTLIEINAASDEAQAWISKKIEKLVGEGKSQEQAAAIAYSMARKKGFDVPEKKKAGGEFYSDVIMQQQAIESSETPEEAVQKLKDTGYVSTFTPDMDSDQVETIEECVDRVWSLYKDPGNIEGSKKKAESYPPQPPKETAGSGMK